MQIIKWGMIGCGDVTEIKSGPAFQKVNNSMLLAVMGRTAEKVKDYARRHQVPRWYDDAQALIADPEVNAIYIATPPSSHEAYAIAAIHAGKPVYVEKPMSNHAEAALNMAAAARNKKVKMVVAHYRRAQPLFSSIKQMLDKKAIGQVRLVQLQFFQTPLSAEAMQKPKNAWRVDPAIAGGGLFHDLAPHQLDLMLYFFGPVKQANGFSLNQGNLYRADDLVTGNLLFQNDIAFSGSWCFTASPQAAIDLCTIVGTEGKMSFSFFGDPTFTIENDTNATTYSFDKLQHVQQPMIQETVNYFLGLTGNPCSGEEGAEVMRLMEALTGK